MTAATSRPPVTRPGSTASVVVEYPSECTLWMPTEMDSVLPFNSGIPHKGETSARWRRNIVLCPANSGGLHPSFRRSDMDHNEVRTYFRYGGQTLRFTMERESHPPRRRFCDYGPRAVLSLYSEDWVNVLVQSPFIADIPMVENTVVVATWNRHRPLNVRRHVVVVPNLTLDWSRRE